MSRTGARLRDPEVGAPKIGGRGGSGFNMLDLGVPQGRAPRPLEKAGRVGLGYEKTETETLSIFMKFLLTNFKFCNKKRNHTLLPSSSTRVSTCTVQLSAACSYLTMHTE